MEYNQPLDSGMYNGLELETTARDYLLETAKWGKFLSIVGFVFIGLMVVVALFAGAMFSSLGSLSGLEGVEGADNLGAIGLLSGGMITGLYLVMAAMYFFPTLYFYRFSTRIKTAVENGSTTDLTAGLSNLKSCIKFWGIFTLVIVGFYALFFVIGIFAALMA